MPKARSFSQCVIRTFLLGTFPGDFVWRQMDSSPPPNLLFILSSFLRGALVPFQVVLFPLVSSSLAAGPVVLGYISQNSTPILPIQDFPGSSSCRILLRSSSSVNFSRDKVDPSPSQLTQAHSTHQSSVCPKCKVHISKV